MRHSGAAGPVNRRARHAKLKNLGCKNTSSKMVIGAITVSKARESVGQMHRAPCRRVTNRACCKHKHGVDESSRSRHAKRLHGCCPRPTQNARKRRKTKNDENDTRETEDIKQHVLRTSALRMRSISDHGYEHHHSPSFRLPPLRRRSTRTHKEEVCPDV